MANIKSKSKEEVDFQKHYQETFYKGCYEAWNDSSKDDRRVFCNLYENIMKALDEMEGVESPMIWCGFYEELKDERGLMDEIKDCFKGKEQIV